MERASELWKVLADTLLRKLLTLKCCKKPTKIFTAQINPMPVPNRRQYFEDDIIK